MIHWPPLYKKVHYLHHRYIKINFGEGVLPFDKLFGTFMDGMPKGAKADGATKSKQEDPETD